MWGNLRNTTELSRDLEVQVLRTLIQEQSNGYGWTIQDRLMSSEYQTSILSHQEEFVYLPPSNGTKQKKETTIRQEG